MKTGLGVSLCNCLKASVLRIKAAVWTRTYTYTMTPLQPEPRRNGKLRVSNPMQPEQTVDGRSC